MKLFSRQWEELSARLSTLLSLSRYGTGCVCFRAQEKKGYVVSDNYVTESLIAEKDSWSSPDHIYWIYGHH